MHQLHKRMNCA